MPTVRKRRGSDPRKCNECRVAFAFHVVEVQNGQIQLCDYCFRGMVQALVRYLFDRR